MSERDDIDVVNKAENNPAAKAESDADRDNITIRQNTPTDEAKASKPGFLDRLKKAFSTEEDEQVQEDSALDEGENLLGSLFGRLKKATDGAEDSAASKQTDIKEGASAEPGEKPEVLESDGEPERPAREEKQPDPAEEEEFLMISAFLEGEEYTPGDDGFDTQDALEEEEAVFEVDDENEYVYTEANGEDNDNNDTADTSENGKKEEKGDVQSSEGSVDGAENVSEEEGAADKAADLAEAPADGAQANSGDGEAAGSVEGSENDGGSGSGEADDEGSAENEKAADTALEGSEEAQNAEDVQSSADVEAAGDDASVREKAESAENSEEIKTEPLDKSDESEDEEFVFEEEMLFDETDDELADIAKLDSMEDFGELDMIFAEDEGETAAAEKSGKVPDTKEYAADGRRSEPLETDGDAPEGEEAFDKTGDEEKPSETDEKIGGEAEQASEEKPAEALENDPGKEAKEESADEASVKEEPADEKPEEKTEKSSEEDKSEEKTEEKQDDKPDGSNGDKSEDKTEGEAEKPAEGKAERFKGFLVKAKNKLVELWNAKDEDGTDSKKTEETPQPDVLEEAEDEADENDGWIVNPDMQKKPQTEAKAKPDEKPEDKADEKTAQQSEGVEDKPDEEEKTSDSETEEKTKEETPSDAKTPQISIIKNENVTKTDFDEDKLREKLNVIERDDTDVLTDEQKKALETNKKVLERVQALEKETAEKREELRREALERESKAEAAAVITELEVTDYRPEGGEFMKFTAGKFSESVKSEYDCIVNYKRMRSVSTKEALIETPAEKTKEARPAAKRAPLPTIGQSSIPELREARDFERNHDKVDSICKKLDYQDERDPEPVEFRTEEDANDVRKYVTASRRRESWTCGAVLGITLASFIFSCFAGRFTVGAGADGAASLQRIFAAVNFLMYAGVVFCCRDIIIGGLLPLKKFRANPDTGVAAASTAAALQALLAIMFPKPFMGQGLSLYTLIVMLTLSVCCVGRYMNADRISANFRFVSDTAQKYAGKFFPDPRMVAKLLSGTKNDKTELSFQKKTTFLKHFMRLSKADDPGDKLASSFALPAIILSLLVALVAGIVSKSFLDAWSVLCVMLCAGVPISSRALAAFPLNRLAKRSLMNKSMIVGYSAVETFSDSAAVMIDSKDLYPEGSIQMNDFKAFDEYRWQDGLYAAAAVSIAAGGAMASMFDTMIDKSARNSLPLAEGVMYEDGKGLIGWVNNERICVGNGRLLRSHGILTITPEMEEDHRSGGDEPLYIAMSGQLVGMLLVGYTANHRVSDVLKRMEASDMSMLVRTTDVNITAERIARDFGVGIKSIKVLEQKNSNVIRDEMVGKEKASPAFIATKGGVTSFGLAVSECIQTKRNVSLSLAVEIVGALLKMLVVTAIVLFAGIHHIGAMQLFLFSLFWVAAVLCAPIVVQKIQGNI